MKRRKFKGAMVYLEVSKPFGPADFALYAPIPWQQTACCAVAVVTAQLWS